MRDGSGEGLCYLDAAPTHGVRSIPIYARLPAGQATGTVGTFADDVTVTLTW